MIVLNGGPRESIREATFLPIDSYSIPFNKGLLLELAPGRKADFDSGHGFDPDHPGKVLVRQGESPDPDCKEVCYYGSVVHVDGEYRMWYLGRGEDEKRKASYAVSKDGMEWTKPNLGIVEYNGSKSNNLVGFRTGDSGYHAEHVNFCLVIHEPDEADASRRFKMVFELHPRDIRAAFSEDGLHWTLSPHNPIIKGNSIETGGLVRYGDCYYLNGQGGGMPHPVRGAGKRSLATYASYDFDHWTQSVVPGFRRDPVPPHPPTDFEMHRGEQVHMGASLWNRGNVLLGIYGQYHNTSNDRRNGTCDLGLVVSNDAMHFREPVPDFKFVPYYEELEDGPPRLLQGQGFANDGERSFFWYGVWRYEPPKTTGVRLATWPRDRFGSYAPTGESAARNASDEVESCHCITCPFEVDADRGARVFVNADNCSEHSTLTVEVLDEQLRVLNGFAAEDCDPITEAGFRRPVSWRGGNTLERIDHPLRLKVNWEGLRAEDARLFALYVEE